MKNLKWLIAALAVLVVFGMTGCPTEGEDVDMPGVLQIMVDLDKVMEDGSVPIGTELRAQYTNPDNIKAKDLSFSWRKDGREVSNQTGENLVYTPTADGTYTVEVTSSGYLSIPSQNNIKVGTFTLDQFRFTGTWVTGTFTAGGSNSNAGKDCIETVTLTQNRFYLVNNLPQVSAGDGGTAINTVGTTEYLDFTIISWDDLADYVKSNTAYAGLESQGYKGYTLRGNSTHNGYANYTTLHVFVNADETKFIRGATLLSGNQDSANIYATREFTKKTN